MAKSHVFLLSILLMASLSYSLPSLGLGTIQVNIRGDFRCSLTGDLNAPPVADAPVYLVCAGSNTTLAETVTAPNGTFYFLLTSTDALLFNPGNCGVRANLPAGNCTLAPPDGVVTASFALLNVIVTSLLTIFNFTTGAFLDMTV